MKILCVFCLVFVVVTPVSQAAMPLLCSKAALKAECLNNVIIACVWVGGSGVAGNSSSTSNLWLDKSAGDYDCTALLNGISDHELTFEVVRPQDAIVVYVGLYDNNGEELFFGYKNGYLQYQDGQYSVPNDLTWVSVMMTAIVDIPLDNPETAQGARINVRDANGQITLSEWLPVENGRLSLPTQYAGKGELIINRYSDGMYWEDWYDLGTMKLIPQQQVAVRLSLFVDGYANYGDDPWSIRTWTAEQADGTFNNLLVRFTVTRENESVPMIGYLYDVGFNNLIDTAYSVMYRKLGDDTWCEQSAEVLGGQIFLTLPVGTYQAFYRFKYGVESNPTPVNFWDNGKG